MKKPNLFLLLGALVLVVAIGLPAFAGNVFNVEKIAVDVTAGSASDARAAALLDGQKRGLQTVIRRLTLRDEWSKLPTIEQIEVEKFVEGFRVSDEKTGRNRYLATLSVQFKPGALSRYLRNYEVAITESQAPSVLLLPVLEDAEGLQAWGENWWRQGWMARDLDNNPAPMTLPLGGIDDSTLIGAEDILIGNPMKLGELNARYGTDTVVVAHALADVTGQLGVTAYIFGPSEADVIVLTYRGAKPHAEMAEQAIDALIDDLNDRWKRIAAVASDDMLELQAKLTFGDLPTWRRQLARLDEANLIRKMSIVEMTANYAYVRFSYIGSLEQLSSNLHQAGLHLAQTENGWQLSEKQEY